jgi:hypothetical protein
MNSQEPRCRRVFAFEADFADQIADYLADV